MAAFESVAEAVFVLRPDAADGAAAEVPFPRLLYGHEPSELADERWRLYQHDRDCMVAEAQARLWVLAGRWMRVH
jgi:hypothetical protein